MRFGSNSYISSEAVYRRPDSGDHQHCKSITHFGHFSRQIQNGYSPHSTEETITGQEPAQRLPAWLQPIILVKANGTHCQN